MLRMGEWGGLISLEFRGVVFRDGHTLIIVQILQLWESCLGLEFRRSRRFRRLANHSANSLILGILLLVEFRV